MTGVPSLASNRALRCSTVVGSPWMYRLDARVFLARSLPASPLNAVLTTSSHSSALRSLRPVPISCTSTPRSLFSRLARPGSSRRSVRSPLAPRMMRVVVSVTVRLSWMRATNGSSLVVLAAGGVLRPRVSTHRADGHSRRPPRPVRARVASRRRCPVNRTALGRRASHPGQRSFCGSASRGASSSDRGRRGRRRRGQPSQGRRLPRLLGAVGAVRAVCAVGVVARRLRLGVDGSRAVLSSGSSAATMRPSETAIDTPPLVSVAGRSRSASRASQRSAMRRRASTNTSVSSSCRLMTSATPRIVCATAGPESRACRSGARCADRGCPRPRRCPADGTRRARRR